MDRALVTGAAGFVGGAVVSELLARGVRVRALLRRPDARATDLEKRGAEIACADLAADPLRGVVGDSDVVVHAAAAVGVHGRRRHYRRANVDALENLLDAAEETGVRRLVHVSSVDVYGYLRAGETGRVDESAPLPTRLRADPYAETKWEAERLLAGHRGKLERVVVRPGWVYGPGDRASLPGLARWLRRGLVPRLGDGAHGVNLVHVRDLAHALAELALGAAPSGTAYNAVGEVVASDRFLDALAGALGAPRPRLRVPARLAFGAGRAAEALWGLGLPGAPPLSRHAVRLLGPQPVYESGRLRARLQGWPRFRFDEAVREASAWLSPAPADAVAGRA